MSEAHNCSLKGKRRSKKSIDFYGASESLTAKCSEVWKREKAKPRKPRCGGCEEIRASRTGMKKK